MRGVTGEGVPRRAGAGGRQRIRGWRSGSPCPQVARSRHAEEQRESRFRGGDEHGSALGSRTVVLVHHHPQQRHSGASGDRLGALGTCSARDRCESGGALCGRNGSGVVRRGSGGSGHLPGATPGALRASRSGCRRATGHGDPGRVLRHRCSRRVASSWSLRREVLPQLRGFRLEPPGSWGRRALGCGHDDAHLSPCLGLVHRCLHLPRPLLLRAKWPALRARSVRRLLEKLASLPATSRAARAPWDGTARGTPHGGRRDGCPGLRMRSIWASSPMAGRTGCGLVRTEVPGHEGVEVGARRR